jgi:predicted GH43/DUF377 family glycosyl hydrolase
MIKVEKLGIILSPTHREFENNAVLNPGIYQDGNTVHILYRAVQEGNLSTIGYAKTSGPTTIIARDEVPLISCDFAYEQKGVEDARVVKIDDTYYVTYTAYDGINVMGALATSTNLIDFEKQGIITPKVNYLEYSYLINYLGIKLNPKYRHYYHLFAELGVVADKFRYLRNKDVVLFPRKINGKFVMLHRIWPGIQIVHFNDFNDLTKLFWEEYLKNLSDYIILDPSGVFEINYIGAGGPPIETEDGWLLIYHGVQATTKGNIYHAKVVLLQLDKPEIVLSRLPYPIFSPSTQWELEGVVNSVVFPSGHALFGDDLYIYYGAADKHIAVAKMNIHQLLLELKKATIK